MLIQPIIKENKNSFELKLKDNFQIGFNYNNKGLSIEGICNNLEDMAEKIRKHYNGG